MGSPPQRSISAQELRDLIEECLSKTIQMHRASRANSDSSYKPPVGPPTEEEITDFVLSNPMYDTDTVGHLFDPGLLGFSFPSGRATEDAIREFKDSTVSWAETNEWLAGDLVPYHLYVDAPSASETQIWRPNQSIQPTWLRQSPSSLLLAAELLKSGRLLSELHWREFEELIGRILEKEGWTVEVTKPTKDGGLDVIALRDDPTIGKLRTIWQAKKYDASTRVGLSTVRELSGLTHRQNATKGVVVTTSHLTKGALDWIRQDIYRLGYKDKELLENWVLRNA